MVACSSSPFAATVFSNASVAAFSRSRQASSKGHSSTFSVASSTFVDRHTFFIQPRYCRSAANVALLWCVCRMGLGFRPELGEVVCARGIL